MLLGEFAIVASWLGMMIVHELGHVLHAWLSGGMVSRIVLNPISFSRTDLSRNSAPLFVAWGGAVWGSAIPLSLWLTVRRHPLAFLVRFFAGFCLVANGLYLAVGAAMPVGDAEEMLRLGCPPVMLPIVGIPLAITGFTCWNGLGRSFETAACKPQSGALPAAAVAALSLAILMTMWTLLT